MTLRNLIAQFRRWLAHRHYQDLVKQHEYVLEVLHIGRLVEKDLRTQRTRMLLQAAIDRRAANEQ